MSKIIYRSFYTGILHQEHDKKIYKRVENLSKDLQTILLLSMTKYTKGIHCKLKDCLCLHPHQEGYSTGLVKRLLSPCIPEKCQGKYRGINGYCSFIHCDHPDVDKDPMYDDDCMNNFYCKKEMCVGHCDSCK